MIAAGQRSAGIVVVRGDRGAWECLLLRAFRNWDFPKGMVEPDEEPLAAAQRETLEETGLENLAFDWGKAFVETAPYARGKVARYYLARLQGGTVYLPVSAELGHPEHDEFRWVTVSDARALVAERLWPVIDWVATQLG